MREEDRQHRGCLPSPGVHLPQRVLRLLLLSWVPFPSWFFSSLNHAIPFLFGNSNMITSMVLTHTFYWIFIPIFLDKFHSITAEVKIAWIIGQVNTRVEWIYHQLIRVKRSSLFLNNCHHIETDFRWPTFVELRILLFAILISTREKWYSYRFYIVTIPQQTFYQVAGWSMFRHLSILKFVVELNVQKPHPAWCIGDSITSEFLSKGRTCVWFHKFWLSSVRKILRHIFVQKVLEMRLCVRNWHHVVFVRRWDFRWLNSDSHNLSLNVWKIMNRAFFQLACFLHTV